MAPDISKHTFSTYSDYWDDNATKKWLEEADKTLRDRYKDARFDYQAYKEEEFSKLEEAIAVNLFALDEKLAKRSLLSNNILSAFNHVQRKTVTKIRQKIAKIGKNKNKEIEMQVVPFLFRLDQDIRNKKAVSRGISVFRIKCKDGDSKENFVDGSARIYDSWKDFLEKNQLPKAMMAYPSDGFLRDTNGNANQIKFCETPACSLTSRTLEKASVVAAWLSPVAAVGMFWCPVGWIGMGLSVASKFVMGYSFLCQGLNIYDKATHDESYTMDILHLISTIGTLVIQKALPKYLKSVARSHRELTKLEYWLITAFLCGMGASQVVSFVGLLYSFTQKEKITALDVLNFVVACQNMYSCIITPKTAERMLEQVRGELAAQEYQKLCQEQAKEGQLKEEISELRRREAHPREGDNVEAIRERIAMKERDLRSCIANQKSCQEEFQAFKSRDLEQAYLKKSELLTIQRELRELEVELNQIDGEGDRAIAIRAEMNRKQGQMETCEQDILRHQKNHQDAVKNKMKDDGAKNKYQEFIDNEQNQENNHTRIDSNGRIIQAMFEMDAEVVFKYAAQTGTTIRFSNGETLDLCINSGFDIHPRAMAQLCHISNGSTDLKKIMELTKQRADGGIERATYLEEIRTVLKEHRMIARDEIAKLKEDLRGVLGIPADGESRFDNLSPAEAYRIRTVIEEVTEANRPAVIQAAQLLAENLHYAENTFRFAECVEIIKVESADKLDRFNRAKEGLDIPQTENLCRNMLNASDEEIGRLRQRNFGKKAVKTFLYEKHSQPGEAADNLKEYVTRRMEEIERYCNANENDLPFSHPLSAVYHLMKHGKDVTQYDSNRPLAERMEIFENLTQEQLDEKYYKNIPKDFFASGIRSNLNDTEVSQNGMSISRTWRRPNGYFGVTKAPYSPYGDPNSEWSLKDPTVIRYVRSLYTSRLDDENVASHYKP